MVDTSLTAARYMYWIGGALIVVVVAWYGYWALDMVGLATQRAIGTVLEKGYRQGGKTYYTQYIDGRPLVIPQERPPAFVVTVQINGEQGEVAIDENIFNRLQKGESVNVEYRRRRLSGKLLVTGLAQ